MLGLLTAALLTQTAPPLVEAVPGPEAPAVITEDPPPTPPPSAATPPDLEARQDKRELPVSDREDVMTKSAWRIHVSAGGGAFNDGTGAFVPGMWVAIGKPIYVGDRHLRHQWFLDSSIYVGWCPSAAVVQLILTPTVGTTWYFGDRFGMEWRAGVGFGATPSARNTGVGLGISIEGGLVFRPFDDDRQRLKIQAREVAVANLLGSGGTLTTIGFSAAYEMPL